MIEKNWKKYYSVDEMKKMTEDYIYETAEDLVLELRKNKKEFFKNNSWKEVVFSNDGDLCMK